MSQANSLFARQCTCNADFITVYIRYRLAIT